MRPLNAVRGQGMPGLTAITLVSSGETATCSTTLSSTADGSACCALIRTPRQMPGRTRRKTTTRGVLRRLKHLTECLPWCEQSQAPFRRCSDLALSVEERLVRDINSHAACPGHRTRKGRECSPEGAKGHSSGLRASTRLTAEPPQRRSARHPEGVAAAREQPTVRRPAGGSHAHRNRRAQSPHQRARDARLHGRTRACGRTQDRSRPQEPRADHGRSTSRPAAERHAEAAAETARTSDTSIQASTRARDTRPRAPATRPCVRTARRHRLASSRNTSGADERASPSPPPRGTS